MIQNCSKLPGNGHPVMDELSMQNYSIQPGNEKPVMANEPGNACPVTLPGNGFSKMLRSCFYYEKTR